MKLFVLVVGSLLWWFYTKEKMSAKEPGESTLTILQTADIHAYLNAHEELFVEQDSLVFRQTGGLSHIKTLVESVRKENPEGTLLVDGGDLIQGSGESVLSQGMIFPPLIREMKYDLLIPGNWEVIYGKQVMMQVMNDYRTQVIVSNMFDATDHKPIFSPYWITEKKGVKLGFIAYNDPEVPERQNPEYSKGIAFTRVKDNLKELIAQLKNNEHVDILFLVAHLGISKQRLLADDPAVKGVDFILGNDTHERIRKPIKGTYAYVVEPGAFGSFVGKLDIRVKNHHLTGFDYRLMEVDPEKYPADEAMQALVNKAIEPYQCEMNRVLGYTDQPLYRYLVVENPMDNLITDALLWKTGADFATSNGFRFGVPIIPDESGKQAITKEDLWRMLPVDEHMKIGKVNGKQIRDWLEKEINNAFSSNPSERFGGWLVRFSGMTLKFNSAAEKGKRILEITIQGKPLDPDKWYTMASCNRTGEPISTMCRMKNASEVSIQDYTLHDAVTAYLKVKGTVSPKLDGRAIAVDLEGLSFSQMPEVGYQFH